MKDILTGFALGILLMTVLHQHQERARITEQPPEPIVQPAIPAPARQGPPAWMRIEERSTALDRPTQRGTQQTNSHYRDEYLRPFTQQ